MSEVPLYCTCVVRTRKFNQVSFTMYLRIGRGVQPDTFLSNIRLGRGVFVHIAVTNDRELSWRCKGAGGRDDADHALRLLLYYSQA